jgi:hypothetical protein
LEFLGRRRNECLGSQREVATGREEVFGELVSALFLKGWVADLTRVGEVVVG